jgi:adenylosuccinate synthase
MHMNRRIASTGKGVGPAMIDKLDRDIGAVVIGNHDFVRDLADNDVKVYEMGVNAAETGVCLLETAQGWSLGINSGFYPYVTTRECSVSQALADMGAAPRDFRKSIAALRTYPIRVGNVEGGSSGPCYNDQTEISFEDIGQPVELTTVTKRPRRIFTWSDQQFRDMLIANKPDALFINFCNYLSDPDAFVADKVRVYERCLGYAPDFVLMGFGPNNEDVKLWSRTL